MKRIYSIDFTRGLVMILMVLDHVRDLMHVSSITQNPVDLLTTTPSLFFTRLITHLCAPIFVFLAGTSAYILFINRQNPEQSRKFLIKRGFWLLFLEFTLINFGVWFDIGFHTYLFQVIAAIGCGLIILSFIQRLSLVTIGITGLTIIFGHNLLSTIPLEGIPVIKAILTPLFITTAFPITAQTTFIMGYPPIPWLGILLIGFASGRLFELPEDKRKSTFLKIGFGSLILFIFLRFINIYGDPSLWSVQKNNLFTFLSFVNLTKYPPSLLFCLITLGIMFIILALAEQAKNRVANFISVFGKVPFFFYLIHWYIIHPLLIVILFIQGFHWADLDFDSGNFGRPKGVESGLELWAIYIIWIGVVLILYYPCRKYSVYKAGHQKWWLKYI